MKDEYHAEGRGKGLYTRFFVYRQQTQPQIDYCECKDPETAQQIAQALNLSNLILDGQIVQSFLFEDESEIFVVVKGQQAEQAYLRALPFLAEGSEQFDEASKPGEQETSRTERDPPEKGRKPE